MPGYPLIDKSNDYLMSRYDKAILDAKPWCEAQQQVQESDSELEVQSTTLSPEDTMLKRLEVECSLCLQVPELLQMEMTSLLLTLRCNLKSEREQSLQQRHLSIQDLLGLLQGFGYPQN